MSQSHIAGATKEYDGRWVSPNGDFLVEVKRTNNARDVRGALLALAYALDKELTSTQAMLVLTQSKLSTTRLHEELNRFRNIVKDGVGRKIHLVAFDEALDRINGASAPLNEDLALFIRDLVLHEKATQGGRVSRAFVQSLIVDRWL